LDVSAIVYKFYIFFFFFQAEDGIRDFHVTGVQTCALPIFAHLRFASRRRSEPPPASGTTRTTRATLSRTFLLARRAASRTGRRRSEERRVGKECRSRWAPSR